MKPNLLTRIVALLLVPCLVQTAVPSSEFQVLSRTRNLALGTWNSSFASQALAPVSTEAHIPFGPVGDDIARQAAVRLQLAPAGPADRTVITLNEPTAAALRPAIEKIPPEVIERIRRELMSHGYPADDVKAVIAAQVLEEFQAQRDPSAPTDALVSQIVRKHTLDLFDWRLTDDHKPDVPWEILSNLRRKKYFPAPAMDQAGLPPSLADAQILVYKALRKLFAEGLLKDDKVFLNLHSGGAVRLSEFARPPRKEEIAISLMMDQPGLTDRILTIEIFHEMIRSAAGMDLRGRNLDDESKAVLRQMVALVYLIELGAVDKLRVDEMAAWLERKGAGAAQIQEFRALVDLTRNSNFYSVRLDQILQYLLHYSGVDGQENRIHRPTIIGLLKKVLDDKGARFYLSSFVRSDSAGLLSKKRRIQKKVDRIFKASLGDERHLTLKMRIDRGLRFLREQGADKWEDIKHLRHPVTCVKEVWAWAILKGGPGFAIVIAIYSTFEDDIVPYLLFGFGHHILATIAFWVHLEPFVGYAYFLLRRTIKQRRFSKGIPNTEYQTMCQRLETRMLDKKFMDRVGIALETYRDYGHFILWYFLQPLDEPSPGEGIGAKEEAIKMLGRILARKRKLDEFDLKIIDRLFVLVQDEHQDKEIRKVAAGAIGKTYKNLKRSRADDHGSVALQVLLGRLNDAEAIVRAAAARSLGHTASRRIMIRMLELLEKEKDLWTQIYAVEAITNIARELPIQRNLSDGERRSLKSLAETLIEIASCQTYSVELRAGALEALGALDFSTEEMASCIREALFDARAPAVKQFAFWAYVRHALTVDMGRNLHEFKNTAYVYLYSQNEDMRYFARTLLRYVASLPISKTIKADVKSFLSQTPETAVAAGRKRRPIVYMAIDSLSVPPRELFSDPRMKETRHLMRDNGHSVFFTASWYLDKTNTPLDKSGAIDPFTQLDQKAFVEAFRKLEMGRSAKMPIFDFGRWKKARERTVVPTGGGAIIVLGLRKEIDSLTQELPGNKTVLSIEDYIGPGKNFEPLIETLEELAPNPALKERRMALDRLHVRSFSEITTRFSNTKDLRDHFMARGVAPEQLVLNANHEALYWIGKEHVSVFSYAKPAIEDDLIWRSGEIISRVGLDDVIHPHFISIELTDKVRRVLTTRTGTPAETKGSAPAAVSGAEPHTPAGSPGRAVGFPGSMFATAFSGLLALYVIEHTHFHILALSNFEILLLAMAAFCGYFVQTMVIGFWPIVIEKARELYEWLRPASPDRSGARFDLIPPLRSLPTIKFDPAAFLEVKHSQQHIGEDLLKDLRSLPPALQWFFYLPIGFFRVIHERPFHFTPLGRLPHGLNEFFAYGLQNLGLLGLAAGLAWTDNLSTGLFGLTLGLGVHAALSYWGWRVERGKSADVFSGDLLDVLKIAAVLASSGIASWIYTADLGIGERALLFIVLLEVATLVPLRLKPTFTRMEVLLKTFNLACILQFVPMVLNLFGYIAATRVVPWDIRWSGGRIFLRMFREAGSGYLTDWLGGFGLIYLGSRLARRFPSWGRAFTLTGLFAAAHPIFEFLLELNLGGKVELHTWNLFGWDYLLRESPANFFLYLAVAVAAAHVALWQRRRYDKKLWQELSASREAA